jgi:hypothetical protein
MTLKEVVSFEDWIKFGFDKGWVGAPVCHTHDGVPMTLAEEKEFDEGHDPCLHILRLYDDLSSKMQVENNHSPSAWRAKNRRLIDTKRGVADDHLQLFNPDDL